MYLFTNITKAQSSSSSTSNSRNKIVVEKLASYENSLYLCSVNSSLLAIRVSFPREGKALSILPILKELLRQLFLFYVFCYEQFMECLALHIFSQNGNAFMPLKYQDFNSFWILFEIRLNVTS